MTGDAPSGAATGPWVIVEEGLDLERLGWSESVFALANGHIGVRGNLDEGEPADSPGTFVNSVFESRPLPVAEPGYGLPESGQTVINVTDAKILRILVDDQPFDVRYGMLTSHRRALDLRRGLLERDVEWTSPSGQAVRIRSTRLVSYTQRAIVAFRLRIEAVDEPARIVVQSELVAGEPQPRPDVADPRVAAALDHPLVPLDHSCRGDRVVLVHRTRSSGIGVAAAMVHDIDGPPISASSCDSGPDLGRTTVTTVLRPTEVLDIVKYAGYGWSTVRSHQALRDQVTAAIDAARHTGWDGLLAEQRAALDDYWADADIEVDGDPDLQAAIRFGLFHAYQAGVRAEGRPIAAKGLTGSGYDGHAFWDSEAFVLPLLCHALPHAARDALRWRHSTLDVARRRAGALNLDGADFAWRTIDGWECSGYWPAGLAAFHVTGAVGLAAHRYVEITGDQSFESEVGADLVVESARLLYSLGHFDADGRFRIDGVTGPDEYSAIADDNLYTNLLASEVLGRAACMVERRRRPATASEVDEAEVQRWRRAAESVRWPFDDRLGVHQQSDDFTEHERWPLATTGPDEFPLFRFHPYFDLYRKQVVKQADLVLAMQLFPDRFDDDQVRRNFDYYETLTVRDSSLSSISQGVVASRLGYADLATAYLRETAMLDLDDLHDNTRDGVHIAASAGSWTAIVHGFGGLRPDRGLRFEPIAPMIGRSVRFRVRCGDSIVAVELRDGRAGYSLQRGKPLTVTHEGHELEVGTATTWRDITRRPNLSPPSQPPGREPPIPPRRARGWTIEDPQWAHTRRGRTHGTAPG